MPAKKKRAPVDWRARADLAGRSALVAIHENEDLRKQLAEAQAESGRHLTAIRELVDAKLKDNAANQAEIEYWMGEVNRLHYELIDMQREAARDAVVPPSDDSKDIEALQDLALRGGVA